MTNPTIASSSPTVGDLLIHYLKLEGVQYLFGVPGGALLHFLVNLKDNKPALNYIICRHETGAAYIADGYYRATGKLGVVAVTTGPGATNALTGVMNAQADGSALLLLTGEVDEKYFGMGYLQAGVGGGLNVNAVFAAATGYSGLLSNGNDAETLVKQALRNALSLPRQAVHLSLPVNVSAEPVNDPQLSVSPSVYRTTVSDSPFSQVRQALTSFLRCKRPLLFIGNGCREALREEKTYKNFLRFVETYNIPVMTTPDGKGIFPEDHELSLRVYGAAGCLWPHAYLSNDAYDGLMIVGSSLGDLSTNKWLPLLIPKGGGAPFIQVDVNPKVIARSFEVTQGIVAEAGAFISDMVDLVKEFPANKKDAKERKAFIAEIKKSSPFIDAASFASKASPLEPAALMRVIGASIPATTKIFLDAGNCVGWAIHYLVVNPPVAVFPSLSMGPMGFAVGAVIGAKMGCPNDTCIALTGDGAFLMQGAEISTAAQYKVGAIWIVLFDNNLSMVSQGMAHFAADKNDPEVWSRSYPLGNPDLVKFSEGLGAEAYDVKSPAELEKLLPKIIKRANKDGVPQVVIAHINKEPVPPYYNPLYLPAPPATLTLSSTTQNSPHGKELFTRF